MTVLRVYRARADPAQVARYEAFERDEGVPMVARMPGCIRVGFARVEEAQEPTYVFFSLWKDRAAVDRARTSPEWKKVVSRLEGLGLTVGEDVAEHWNVVALQEAALAAGATKRA